MRLFRYEPGQGVSDPHRDLGLLTLCVCRGRGLQVWQQGGWQDAPAVTLVVGDTLRVLSSNRIPAGMHQVEATASGRSSIIFALRSSTRPVIDLAAFGGHGAIAARELWDAIRNRRVNVNMDKDARDKMRARIKTAPPEDPIP